MVNQTKADILLVDIGNSSVKWASYSAHGLTSMLKKKHPENVSSNFFKECWIGLDKPKDVIVSCVADDSVWLALAEACNELWNIKAQKVVSSSEEYGLVNAYSDATALGSDRWCAMLGGLQTANSAFLIIDAGSALTIDMVSETGKHLGGHIVPGLGMMRESLGHQTALVETTLSKDNITSLSLANSTVGCVESGIYLSVVKLIEAVYEREAKQVKQLTCFLTGSDAAVIADLLIVKSIIMPDLVLRGLAAIASNELK
jgi:type III pantothenate kinase